MSYEFWFAVGSQTLYGPEVLATVERHGREMAAALSRVLPFPIVYKNNDQVRGGGVAGGARGQL